VDAAARGPLAGLDTDHARIAEHSGRYDRPVLPGTDDPVGEKTRINQALIRGGLARHQLTDDDLDIRSY
jgi:hypothetical protein